MLHYNKLHEDCVNWIREWFEKNGPDCHAVIGISGGKDSTVVAALCAEALGNDRVIGVLMPDGEQDDIEDSYKIVKALGIKYIEVNVGNAITNICCDIMRGNVHNSSKNISHELTPQALQNLPPRIRMATLYAVSQMNNGRVINTCNLSESLLGWETRWGDAVGDMSPLRYMTATDVINLGLTFDNLPKALVRKTPSDGLCGKTDEDKFGFTYSALDNYITMGKIDDLNTKEKIDSMIRNSAFKRIEIAPFFIEERVNDVAMIEAAIL